MLNTSTPFINLILLLNKVKSSNKPDEQARICHEIKQQSSSAASDVANERHYIKMTNDGNYMEFDPRYLVFDITYFFMRHETSTNRRTAITGKKDTTRAQRENGREKGCSAEQAHNPEGTVGIED